MPIENSPAHQRLLWLSQANNPLGEEIAKIMAEGKHYDAYDNGPEFHYAIAAALRAPTADEALRHLLDTFEGLQTAQRKLMAHATELAKFQPTPIILVRDKNVDKPGTG